MLTSLPGMAFSLYLALKNPGELLFIAIAVFYGLLSLPFVVLRWLFFQFQITPTAVNIHTGIIARQYRSIPVEKIQNVEIRQNFLQRILGLAQVSIETASVDRAAEGNLQFVGRTDAEHIRNALQSYKQGNIAVVSEEKSISPIFAMTSHDVLVGGMMRFSPILFAAAFSASQYWQALSGNDAFGIFILKIQALEGGALILTLAGLSAGAALFSWIGGIVLNFSRFYGFKLFLNDNKLHKEHGLFARWKGTIPLRKIQMLTISANPLMRAFGFARLEIQTAGFGNEKFGAENAVPMSNFRRVVQLAHTAFNFTLPETFLPLSPFAIRRAALRYATWIILLCTTAGVFLSPFFYLGLFLLPAAYFTALLHYRWRGYAVDSFGNVIARSGWLNNRISIIPTGKIQTLTIRRSFLQRRLGLATVVLDVAALASLRDISIADISAADAENFIKESASLSRNSRKRQ